MKSRMDRKFSRIENLWPRDGSCSHAFGKRSFYGYRGQPNVSFYYGTARPAQRCLQTFQRRLFCRFRKGQILCGSRCLARIPTEKSTRARAEAFRGAAVSRLEAHRPKQRYAGLKIRPLWPLLHPQKRTIDFGRWFFLFCWRFAGWCGILGSVQQLGICGGKHAR